MILAIDASVKVTLLMLVGLGATFLLRQRSAAVRHWALAVALTGAAVTPVLTLFIPAWQIPLPMAPRAERAVAPPATSPRRVVQQPSSTRSATSSPNATSAARLPFTASPASLAAAIWMTGTGVSALMLVIGFVRLGRVQRSATTVASDTWTRLASDVCSDAGVRRPVALLQTDHPTLLFTWGVGAPKIVLPVDACTWTADRVRIVLRHELAHVARADWAVQMIGELVRAVHWFNPLVWIACRRLREDSERACDDAVLNAGVDAAEYASHLVDLARTLNVNRRAYLPAPAMARPSSLEGRVAAMLNPRVDRRPLTRSTRIAIAFALLCVATMIAGVAAQRFSTFSGSLLDQSNAFLPNVAVSLTNNNSKVQYKVRTDSSGHFEFVGLPDGEYALAAEEPGFAPFTDAITIAGRDVVRAIQLQLGSLHETITITGGGPAAATDPAKRQEYRQRAEEQNRKAAEACASGTFAAGIGGNIRQPTKVADFKPRYPESLQAAKIGGVVTLEAVIGTDGFVRDVRIVTGVNPELDNAAVEAVRQWEFSATLLNSCPVEVHMNVTANFKP
jgi:TonB family protein